MSSMLEELSLSQGVICLIKTPFTVCEVLRKYHHEESFSEEVLVYYLFSTGNLGWISSILGQLAPSSPGAAAEDDAAAVEPSGRALKLPNIPFAAAFSAAQAGSTIYFCSICSNLVSGFFGPSAICCGKGCLICSYLVSIFFGLLRFAAERCCGNTIMKIRLPRKYSFNIFSTGNLGWISSILGQLAPSSPGAAAEDDAAAVEPSGRALKLPNIPFAAAFSAAQAWKHNLFLFDQQQSCQRFLRPFCDLLWQGLFDLQLSCQHFLRPSAICCGKGFDFCLIASCAVIIRALSAAKTSFAHSSANMSCSATVTCSGSRVTAQTSGDVRFWGGKRRRVLTCYLRATCVLLAC
jgi:hypothetical protein